MNGGTRRNETQKKSLPAALARGMFEQMLAQRRKSNTFRKPVITAESISLKWMLAEGFNLDAN